MSCLINASSKREKNLFSLFFFGYVFLRKFAKGRWTNWRNGNDEKEAMETGKWNETNSDFILSPLFSSFSSFCFGMCVCVCVCVCVNTFHCILCETKAPEPEIVFFLTLWRSGTKKLKLNIFAFYISRQWQSKLFVLLFLLLLLLLLLLLYCCCSLLKCIHV